jgi:hypothetical protein
MDSSKKVHKTHNIQYVYLISNCWRPTKFRFWKSRGLEMSIWKFPHTSLGDVSLIVQKEGSFQRGIEIFILN